MDRFSLIQGFRYFNVYGEFERIKGDQASPVTKFTKEILDTGKLKLFEGSDKFLEILSVLMISLILFSIMIRFTEFMILAPVIQLVFNTLQSVS